MGLLVECLECKKRNSHKAKACKCGFALAKFSGRVFWIEYLVDGQRRRERIGPNKEAADQRLREVLTARTEGRYIQKSPDARTLFKDLAAWYLDLPEMQAKRIYDRDRQSLNRLLPFFGDRLLKGITPAPVEAYRQRRLGQPSGRAPYGPTKPASVNGELAVFKTISAKGIKNDKVEKNPAQGLKLLKENNERNRILSPDEYIRLVALCPPHIESIVKLAYHTGMRQGEILNLTWGQVDVKEGFIKLEAWDTKTRAPRLVPLTREPVEMFKAMPRGLPAVKVFTQVGKSEP